MNVERHVRDLTQRLEHNQSRHINIQLRLFETDDQVARVAQALHGNDSVDTFCLLFYDGNDSHAPAHLNWGPLVQELESREKLRKVEVLDNPPEHLLPLFRDQLFQALQQNTNLQSMKLLVCPIFK